MEFFRQLFFTRQSTDSNHEEEKANRPSINESSAERIAGVKRLIEEVVEDDTVGDDPEIVVNLHLKKQFLATSKKNLKFWNPIHRMHLVLQEK